MPISDDVSSNESCPLVISVLISFSKRSGEIWRKSYVLLLVDLSAAKGRSAWAREACEKVTWSAGGANGPVELAALLAEICRASGELVGNNVAIYAGSD